MGIRGKFRQFALLALLIALPLAALDVSAVKQGCPSGVATLGNSVRSFETPVKEGARLLLRAAGGAVSIRPVPGDKVSCNVILRAYTSDEAKARRLFDNFQLSTRSVEAGAFTSPANRLRRDAARRQFSRAIPNRGAAALQPGRGNAGWRHRGGSSSGGRSAADNGGWRRARQWAIRRRGGLKPPAAASPSAKSAAT